MDMDQVQRKDINNLMNDSLSKELDIHIGEYDEESKEYTFNINPFNYATVECNNWIMDFDELSKSYVPSGDSIIFLFNDKVKLSELSLKHISRVVLSFTVENCIVESIGFGSSVIDFVEVNSSGDVSVSLDLSKYSVNELVKLFSDDLFSIVVVLSNDLNGSNSVLKDWNLQFIFKDLLLDEKEATKNRIEEFTESTYLKKDEIIDTGWLDLPLTNNFLPYNNTSYKPMYRCIGGLVFIKGAVKPKNELKPTSVNDFYIISNLPLNCSLDSETTTFVKHGSSYNLFSLEIRSNQLGFGRYATGGTLTTSIPNTAWININCCYCIDDIVLGMINNIIESVGDYNTLNNKPSINGQTLIGDTSLFIPNRTSELINDNDFITSTYHDNTKVDKVSGKGLSTVDFTDTNYVHTDNNYTNSEKNKLASLENYDDTDVWVTLQELEENKQNTLIAGSGISIVGNVISVTGTIKPLTELILTSDKLVTSNEVTLTTHLQFLMGESGRGDIANATIQFYKKVDGEADVLIGSSFTDEYGVCSLDTSISENTIFYAYYSGDNDYEPSTSNDLTIEKSLYIFYDECNSEEGLSNYNNIYHCTTGGTSTLTFDNVEKAYTINGSGGKRNIIQFGDTLTQNNIRISADIRIGSTSWARNGMLGIADQDNPTNNYVGGYVQGEKYYRLMEIYNNNEVSTSHTKWTSLGTNNYNHHELEYSNGILKYTVTTQSGASKTIQLTERMSWIGKALGLFVETNNGINCWIKNIKVESL